MNENILSYVYDFLSFVMVDIGLKKRIKGIILFGSVAKESYDKKSDIDVFFDVNNVSDTKFVENELKNVLKSFEIKSKKTWNLKGINLPLNFIVGSLEDKMWEALKDELISSGIVLYGSYNEIPKEVKHYLLFYYTLRNLKRKNKMRFIRKFFGYTLKKGKRYGQKGIIEKINGLKLASNVVLVPSGEIVNVKKIFNDFRVKYRVMETWIRL